MNFTDFGYSFFMEDFKIKNKTFGSLYFFWSFQQLRLLVNKSLREGLNEKKTFSFGHCPNDGGGVYPCPNFLALFLEVHFWSIKRVYFFKNANVLNF